VCCSHPGFAYLFAGRFAVLEAKASAAKAEASAAKAEASAATAEASAARDHADRLASEVSDLTIAVHKASHTTRTYKDIGEVRLLPFLVV